MSNTQLEKLQLEQMAVYADMLLAFEKSAKLITDIGQVLSMADFTNHHDIQTIYTAIYQANTASKFLTSAFKTYAQSHMIVVVDPE